VTGEPDHHCPVEPFGQKPEYHFDLFGLGFEIVERCPLAHREGLVAGLTTQFADALGLINPTIADQGVNSGVGDPEIMALGTGASISGGINGLLGTAIALTLRPR
jgi:hypothetical protein